MTVIMTLIGIGVFVISAFTAGFKPAFKRLIAFALTGAFIDILLISLTFTSTLGAFYYF